MILASSRAAPKVSDLLAASRIEELPAPAGIGEKNLLRALPAIKSRLAEIGDLCHGVDAERQALAATEGAWLSGFRVFLRDHLLRLDARARVFATERLSSRDGCLRLV